MRQFIQQYSVGCMARMTRTFRTEFHKTCSRCPHNGDPDACKAYRVENDLAIVLIDRE